LLPCHGLFLGGASGVRRDKDGVWCEILIEWLGYKNKRMLRGEAILEWLLSLADKYPNAIFVMFGMSYDATQILKALGDFLSQDRHFRKIYEICKRKKHGTKRSVKAAVYVGNYSIDYLKGRRLVIKKIEKGEDGVIRTVKKITIYDLFGFYQSSFVKVVESLVPLGLATPEEVERIRSDKARRAEFRQVPIEEIKLYTTLELRKLSIAATALRDGFDRMGIRLNSWMGPGAAASALLKKEGVARHYAGFVRKYNISEEQRIAHAGFAGGHIELIKQGLSKDAIVFQYDKRSAHPSVCLKLPSMIGGRFRREETPAWNEIEDASPLS
jgi:hypothetical protein